MKRRGRSCACGGVAVLLTLILPCFASAQSPIAVLTGQYNRFRTSANLNETTLAPSNVSASSFGLLFTQPVDANIFAQPLYVPGTKINGALHNVVFVATLNNSVYAFDADTSQPALWSTNLGKPVHLGTPLEPAIGILSTPVIDIGLSTIFVVTFTIEGKTPLYRLHALNILTGAEIAKVPIRGAVPGTGDDSQITPCVSWNNGVVSPPCIPFKASEQLQRPSLLEGIGHATIYVAFGTMTSTEATSPYHGWLFGYAYSPGAFQQTMIFNTTTSATQVQPACSTPANQCGHGSGIWMSGRGPAFDSTGVYVATGNGGYGGAGSGNWGESALRLSGSGVVEDHFAPQNYATLNSNDLDLGDGGVILLVSSNQTAPNLALVAGKSGGVSLLNRAALGGLTGGNSGALQTFTATTSACGSGPGQSGCYEIHSPALWNPPSGETMLYVWAQEDVLRVWDFDPTDNVFRPDANQGKIIAPGYPGAGLAISANGNSNGIVWGTVSSGFLTPSSLYAFDATNVTKPLWSSTDYWFATKFSIPTVANGKVYVPTSASLASAPTPYSPALRVYGLCGTCAQASRQPAGPEQ